MRKFLSLGAGILLAVTSAGSALAAPPEKFTEPAFFVFPDFDLGLVVFINMDRETLCTAEQVAFEEALTAWIEGGELGDPPEEPAAPEGFEPVSFLVQETAQGAIVQHLLGLALVAEVWEMDADAPGIGPCTDTDDALNLIGTGTAEINANDNDLFGSGTRGNAFGDRGVINLLDEDGNTLRYSWLFHVNSQCHFFGDEPNCVVERSSLK